MTEGTQHLYHHPPDTSRYSIIGTLCEPVLLDLDELHCVGMPEQTAGHQHNLQFSPDAGTFSPTPLIILNPSRCQPPPEAL